MKKFLFTLLCFYLAFSGHTQVFTGAKFFSGTNSNWIQDVVTDPSGNIYCTGYFYGDIDLDILTASTQSGNAKGFVMKTDPAGNPAWVVLLNSSSTNSMAIERTSDGSIYVGGSFRSTLVIGNDSVVSGSANNVFIAKFSNSGALTWLKHFPGKAGDNLYNRMNLLDLARDNSGNIYYTGFFTTEITLAGTTLTASGTNDAFYGKMDPSGNSVWFKKCGGTYGGGCGLPNNDSGNSIDLDDAGNIFLAGHFAFNFTIGGLTAPGGSDIDAFIAKLDNAGNTLWVRSVPGLAVQTGTGVTADPWGNSFLAMRFQIQCYVNGDTLYSYSLTGSPYDMVILKYDPSGNIAWYRQEGLTAGGDYPEAIVSDQAGNIFLCGNFTGSTQMGDTTLSSSPSWADRIFVVSYTPAGNANFVIQCGGEKNFPYAMTLNQNNDLVLAGSADIGSTSGIQFGSFTCPGSYGHYPYIVTLDHPVTGISKKQTDDPAIDVFPNPSSGRLFVRSEKMIDGIKIFDLSGMIVFSADHNSNEADLNLRLIPGTYIISVQRRESTVTRRLLMVR